MRRNINVGIDVGTHDTRVVLVEYTKNSTPTIVGTGKIPTDGMRMGYVTDIDNVSQSIKKAILQAEGTANLKIKHAYISCGGIGMTGEITNGYSIISRADKEVTNLDVKNAIDESEENINLQNKKIIYVSPISYRLDGKAIYGDPVGMKGAKLEAKVIFITSNKKHVDDLVSAVAETGIEIDGIYPGILASAKILLSEKQKTAGCALIDIGEDITTLAVFEDNTLISLVTYSIGGSNITADIALYFKISLEEAEGVKIGSILGDYPKKQVDEIIEARLGDIFESVENHLKKLKRNGLLPAGVIITGGGAHIANIEKVAKSYLNLPTQIGPIDKTLNQKFKIRDDTWYSAMGLALSKSFTKSNFNSQPYHMSNVKKDLGGFKQFFKSILSQLLP